VVHAEAEAAAGAPAYVAGPLPALRVPTGGSGHRPEPADATGMGALLCRGRLLPMFGLPHRWGGKAGAAASEACAAPPGLWLEAVEAAVAVWHVARVAPLSGASAAAASAPSVRGPIPLHRQQAGKRSAGKPRAAFDVAGAGNVTMVER